MEISRDRSLSIILGNIEELFCSDNKSSEKTNHALQWEFVNSLKGKMSAFHASFIEEYGYSLKEMRSKLLHLIIISNKIYVKLIGFSNNRGKIRYDVDRNCYLMILEFIEDAIDSCEPFLKEVVEDLPITDFKLSTLKFTYNKSVNSLKNLLSNPEIESELGKLLIWELTHFIRRKQVIRSEFCYITELKLNLLKIEDLTTEGLEEFLIKNNFNCLSFFNYCLKKSNAITLLNPSLHQQLDVLISMEENLNNIPRLNFYRLTPSRPSIIDELNANYKDRKKRINQRIDIRRTQILDERLFDDNDKIQVNLSVAQMGFFVRLLIDNGILPKDNIGKTFGFFARHFRTHTAAFISTESLQKKSTTVEFSTAKKIKGHLIEMINTVNKNYNTSNFSD